jgi:hypothetical protein
MPRSELLPPYPWFRRYLVADLTLQARIFTPVHALLGLVQADDHEEVLRRVADEEAALDVVPADVRPQGSPTGSGQPNRSDLEFYRVTDQAHFVGRDIFRRRIHRDAAVFDIEV